MKKVDTVYIIVTQSYEFNYYIILNVWTRKTFLTALTWNASGY